MADCQDKSLTTSMSHGSTSAPFSASSASSSSSVSVNTPAGKTGTAPCTTTVTVPTSTFGLLTAQSTTISVSAADVAATTSLYSTSIRSWTPSSSQVQGTFISSAMGSSSIGVPQMPTSSTAFLSSTLRSSSSLSSESLRTATGSYMASSTTSSSSGQTSTPASNSSSSSFSNPASTSFSSASSTFISSSTSASISLFSSIPASTSGSASSSFSSSGLNSSSSGLSPFVIPAPSATSATPPQLSSPQALPVPESITSQSTSASILAPTSSASGDSGSEGIGISGGTVPTQTSIFPSSTITSSSSFDTDSSVPVTTIVVGQFPSSSSSAGSPASPTASASLNMNGTMSNSAPSGSTLDRSSDLARKRATIAGAVVGGFFGALVLLIGALCLYRRHARARRLRQRQQMLRQHRSTPSSFLDYDANPFDRATGTESVRTAADAFRGMSHYSSPSAGSLTSMRFPPALALAEDGAAQTPRSWDTFRPSPLRSASPNASPTDTSGARSGVDASPTSVASHAPLSPSIAIPLTTPVEPPAAWGPSRSSLTLWPRGGEPDAAFNSSRSSKASSNYSGLPMTSKRPSFGDSVDPFRDSGHIASPGLLPPLEPRQWVAI